MATRLRRISQIIFFLLFSWFLVRTKLGNFSSADRRMEFLVNPFLKLDPLIALVNALSGHALERSVAWAAVILIPPLFLGRFFCGWICPLGSLNQFLGGIRFRSMRRSIKMPLMCVCWYAPQIKQSRQMGPYFTNVDVNEALRTNDWGGHFGTAPKRGMCHRMTHAPYFRMHSEDQNWTVRLAAADRPRPVSGLIWLIHILAMKSSKFTPPRGSS